LSDAAVTVAEAFPAAANDEPTNVSSSSDVPTVAALIAVAVDAHDVNPTAAHVWPYVVPAAADGSTAETVTTASPPATLNSTIPAEFVVPDVLERPLPK